MGLDDIKKKKPYKGKSIEELWSWCIDFSQLTSREYNQLKKMRVGVMIEIAECIREHYYAGNCRDIIYAILRKRVKPTTAELAVKFWEYAKDRKLFVDKRDMEMLEASRKGVVYEFKDAADEKKYNLWSRGVHGEHGRMLFDERVKKEHTFQFHTTMDAIRNLIESVKQDTRNEWLAIVNQKELDEEEDDGIERFQWDNAWSMAELKQTEDRGEAANEGRGGRRIKLDAEGRPVLNKDGKPVYEEYGRYQQRRKAVRIPAKKREKLIKDVDENRKKRYPSEAEAQQKADAEAKAKREANTKEENKEDGKQE